jgi:mevalonate kinase
VVHGHPAIALALPLGTTVTLESVDGPSRMAQPVLTDDPRPWTALMAVLPAHGVLVSVTSDLPLGAGLGSSAALAVATVRALAAREGRAAGFDEIFERAFAIERVFHGAPSGIDHATSALGGAVRYRRGDPVQPIALCCPLHLVVAHSGEQGNTAEMVAAVRARAPWRELDAIAGVVGGVERWFREGRDLAEAGTEARLRDLGGMLEENQVLLRAIGVSTAGLDALCAGMTRAGAYGAKLAGAGGGGVAIALCDAERAEAVLDAVRDAPGGAWSIVARARPGDASSP